MTDAALIAKVLDGNIEAFSRLVERHYESCARFATRMLGNREDAEDALQETFLRAYGSLGRYQERDRFQAWLYRILVNQCRSMTRQRHRRNRHAMDGATAGESAVVHSSERQLEIGDALQASLGTLDPLLREAFLLKYGEELEYSEMAAITGAGISALKMRVQRACHAMRPRLEEFRHG
jgi:RNA polymerase sigma-70 factor (ECF subfamily)